MRTAVRFGSHWYRRIFDIAKRRPLPLLVGFFVTASLISAGCRDFPTEVAQAPVNGPRLNVSEGDGPTVATDREDYTPGDVVAISGWSWESGETVTLRVVHVDEEADNDRPAYQPWDITADANGSISSTWEVTEDDVGATLKLTADGQTSGAHAEVLFSDLIGTPLVWLFADAGRTTTQSAYAWGATIYPRVTTGAGQINICYRIRWFNPSDAVQQTTIVGKGSLSYDVASFSVPATGPSGTWYAILDENNGALDCTTAAYGGASNRINFDVARAVIVGAGTSGGDAVGGDQCVYQASQPPASGCAGATSSRLWVSSQTGNVVRSFVHFDLSQAIPAAIPAGVNVTSALVRLSVEGTPSAQREYDIHRVTGSWNETDLTSPSLGPAVAASATDDADFLTTLTPGTGGGNPQTWVKWSVTADVQGFLNGTFTNRGWRISDKNEGTGNVSGRFHSTENTGACDAGATCTRVMPVLLIDYTDPPKLAFITSPFTGQVGECLGPMTVQSQDFGGSPLAVGSDLTVNLSTANLGVGSINGTPGAGSFFSNGTCTTGATTTTITSGNTNSASFYYRATGRGDGTHDVVASATDYTPDASQTQTINKALTTLVYTGDRVVFVGNTFNFSAILNSAWAPCKDNKRILFRIIPSPLTGSGFFDAPAPHPMTNSSGVATKSVPTTGWIEDIYDARASFSGDDDCEASKDDYSVAVLTPGGAATGGGFLAGSKVGGGRANFAFNIRPIDGSDPIAYKGQFLLIRQDGGDPSFRCKGAIELYGIVDGSDPLLNVASGKCDFQVWNPTLNGGEGGWEVPYGAGYTNRPFIIQFIDNGSGKGKNAPPPDEFGFSISFVGAAVADPSFDIAPINGGNIDVKNTGGSTTTTSGGGGGSTGPGNGKKK